MIDTVNYLKDKDAIHGSLMMNEVVGNNSVKLIEDLIIECWPWFRNKERNESKRRQPKDRCRGKRRI